MAKPLNPKEVVSLEEIAISNMYEIEALIEVLARKGIISKEEVLEEIKKMRLRNGSSNNNLKEIYSQHWQHIRHIENERLAFTSFYLVFLGAGLAYFFRLEWHEILQKYLVLGFLLVFSALGFLVMVRVLVTGWYHYLKLQEITPRLCGSEKLDYEGAQGEIEAKIREKEKGFWWLNKT